MDFLSGQMRHERGATFGSLPSRNAGAYVLAGRGRALSFYAVSVTILKNKKFQHVGKSAVF